MSRTVQRLTLATGILAVVVMVVYIILSPDAGSQGDSVRRITDLNIRNSSAILGWTYVGALTNLLILVYLCRILNEVIGDGPRNHFLRTLATVGATGFIVFGLMNKLLTATLAYDAPRHLPAGLVAVLYDALTSAEYLIMFPLAIVVATVSIAALESGRLPRVLAWIGFPIASIQLVCTAGLASPGGGVAGLTPVGLLLTLLWIGATSVTLIVRVSRDVPVHTEAPGTVGVAHLAT